MVHDPGMSRVRRSLTIAFIGAAVLSACGIWGTISENDDCGLRPLGQQPTGLRIGPQPAAASCASQVEVDGRVYGVGVGRWLDEDALVLTVYGQITRSNEVVREPIAYALQGVDPLEFLVMKANGDRDDSGPMRPYLALWGAVDGQPEGICPYADPLDPQYAGDECSLQRGRTYAAEMNVVCGLDVPIGPYGGEYWLVVDPPAEPPAGTAYPGMYQDLDYGTIELLADGSLRYRSERGAQLRLEPAGDPKAGERVCPRRDGY
jgi:hypothetical protein